MHGRRHAKRMRRAVSGSQHACIGCYGPPEGVYSQAGKMASTLGSILDIDPIRDLRETEALNARVDEGEKGIPDLAGVACKFNLATTLRRDSIDRRMEER